MAKHVTPADPRGGHVRLYWDMLDGNAWRCLSATDQRAYIAIHRQVRSTNNGDLSLPLSVARTHGITSPATLAKSLRALVAVGLIAVTRKGGCTRGGQRLPTLYRLTDRECYEVPAKHIEAVRPSNEWRAIKTLAQGRDLIRQAEGLAAEKSASTKKSPLQYFAHTTSKIEVVEAVTTSKNEAWTPTPLQKLKHGKNAETASKPNNGGEFVKSGEIHDLENHTSNIEALSTYYQRGDESLAQPETAVRQFKAHIGGKLSTPEREPNPLGRARQIHLFKDAFGYLFAQSKAARPVGKLTAAISLMCPPPDLESMLPTHLTAESPERATGDLVERGLR